MIILFDKPLDSDTRLLFAGFSANYKHAVTISELMDDYKKASFIRTMFRTFHRDGGGINYRLLVNHCIIFFNVFGSVATSRILFSLCEIDLHQYVYTLLDYLNILPKNGDDIKEADLNIIPCNKKLSDILRSL